MSLTSLSGSLFLFILYKERRTEKILASENSNDYPEWDFEDLKYNTRFVFYKVQAALNSNDISVLQDYATQQFLSWFKEVLANKKNNTITNIVIDETHVICCRDFLNNDKDQYAGYIKGHLIKTGDDDEEGKQSFSEVYHFTRAGSNWLLNKVSSAGIWNIAFLSNTCEQANRG